MDCNTVLSALHETGYAVRTLQPIQEGSIHHVFDVTLENGSHAICKFAKTRTTELGLTAPNLDTLFGGRLSLDRESYLLSLARVQGGLPVPEVYGTHDSPCGRFIMVEKSPGISFTEWQKQTGYRLAPYLSSLQALGRDFAKLHRNIYLPSFGDTRCKKRYIFSRGSTVSHRLFPQPVRGAASPPGLFRHTARHGIYRYARPELFCGRPGHSQRIF